MKSTFLYINRSLFHETEIYLLIQPLFYDMEIYLFKRNLFYEIKIYLFNQNLLFSIEVYLWNLSLVYWIEVNSSNLRLFFQSKFNFSESKLLFGIQICLIKWKFVLSNQRLSCPSVTKKKIIVKVCSVFAVESHWQLRGLFVLVAEQKKWLH